MVRALVRVLVVWVFLGRLLGVVWPGTLPAVDASHTLVSEKAAPKAGCPLLAGPLGANAATGEGRAPETTSSALDFELPVPDGLTAANTGPGSTATPVDTGCLGFLFLFALVLLPQLAGNFADVCSAVDFYELVASPWHDTRSRNRGCHVCRGHIGDSRSLRNGNEGQEADRKHQQHKGAQGRARFHGG